MSDDQPDLKPSAKWNALADRYELLYRVAERSLDGQEASLDELRSRAGTVVAAAAIVTSFLGGAALSDGQIGGPGAAAVLAFGILTALCLWTLYPSDTWHFRQDASKVRSGYIERDDGPASLAEMYRGLADELTANWHCNTAPLRRRFRALGAAVVLLAAEVVLWLWELRG